MLKVRIIPCLDVKNDKVVKGVQFKNHEIVGNILELAKAYSDEGADELVFYDITASSDHRRVSPLWIKQIAETIHIPFCVAGGIRSVEDAQIILGNGADKISINSPALENPDLIDMIASRFGTQCMVVGIDSFQSMNEYFVCQYTGDIKKTVHTNRKTMDWIHEVIERGAGEIVLNCMNQDGMKNGYDIPHLSQISNTVNIPIIASGGAGQLEHFKKVFQETRVTGALAASVFHKKSFSIKTLKEFLDLNEIKVRIC